MVTNWKGEYAVQIQVVSLGAVDGGTLESLVNNEFDNAEYLSELDAEERFQNEIIIYHEWDLQAPGSLVLQRNNGLDQSVQAILYILTINFEFK